MKVDKSFFFITFFLLSISYQVKASGKPYYGVSSTFRVPQYVPLFRIPQTDPFDVWCDNVLDALPTPDWRVYNAPLWKQDQPDTWYKSSYEILNTRVPRYVWEKRLNLQILTPPCLQKFETVIEKLDTFLAFRPSSMRLPLCGPPHYDHFWNGVVPYLVKSSRSYKANREVEMVPSQRLMNAAPEPVIEAPLPPFLASILEDPEEDLEDEIEEVRYQFPIVINPDKTSDKELL